MPYHHGFLWFADRESGQAYEIFNHARTAAYLRGSAAMQARGILDVQADGGCWAYAYDPPCEQDSAVMLTRVTGGYVSTPDNAALDLSTGLDIRIKLLQFDEGNNSRYLLAKESSGTTSSYLISFDSSYRPVLSMSTTGTGYAGTATAPERLSARIPIGQAGWLRVTWRNSDGQTRWYTSEDGVTWLPWGSIATIMSGSTIFNSTSPVELGSFRGGNAPFGGLIYAAQIRSSIDGTIVGNFISTGTSPYTDSAGRVWTLQGSASFAYGPSGAWVKKTYSTPLSDMAPWVTGDPASWRAHGFWVLDWTGLDSPHVKRGVQPLGSLQGGGQLGRLGARERVMAFNVMLFGEDEEALEYLFRWLEATLMSVCSPNSLVNAMVRRFCPQVTGDPRQEDIAKGVAELRDVALIEGLQWSAPLGRYSGCVLRQASFTLAAGDPCMYEVRNSANPLNPAALETTPLSLNTCFAATGVDTTRSTCRPDCVELDKGGTSFSSSSCRVLYPIDFAALGTINVGAAGLYVQLRAVGSNRNVPTRVAIYADPLNLGGASRSHCGAPLVAEIYTQSLPAGSDLVWDLIGRRILYRDGTTGLFVNGYAYISTNTVGVPRFAPLSGCSRYLLSVEPASLCFSGSSGAWVDADGLAYGDAYLPEATIFVFERMGCP